MDKANINIDHDKESHELYKVIVYDEKVSVVNIHVPRESSWLGNGKLGSVGIKNTRKSSKPSFST